MNSIKNKAKSNPHIGAQCEEGLDDCTFLSNCYPSIPIFEETYEFVAAKVVEIEKEVDKISSHLKEAYYIAIEQEIQQRTNYVRSTKFLLMFLRAESFDAGRAALRMVNFFKWKLHLFGLETLTRPIRYDDLNEDDRTILRSEYIHYSGEDCGGRPVLFCQLKPLLEAGVCHQRYLDNINRIGFYVRMCIIEGNEECQKNGMIVIKWGLETKITLKDFRFMISLVKLFTEAMPLKLVAAHDCRLDNLTNSWMAYIQSFLPKYVRDKNIIHIGRSATTCFSTLSQYGIDVDAFPSNISGNFGQDFGEQLDQLQQKHMTAILTDIDKVQPLSNDMNEVSLMTRYVDKEVEGIYSIAKHSVNWLPEKISNNDEKSAAEFDKFSIDLLEILEKNKASNAIFWSQGGKVVAIRKKEFSDLVLSTQLGGIKFDSFTRKLKRCGFQRLTPNNGSSNIINSQVVEFKHPLFQRNSRQLIEKWQVRKEQGLKTLKFPVKLMNALENDALSNAIWWVCDGNAFAIEKNRFFSDVLEIYFSGMKMDSFFRMLGKWDFHRMPAEEKSSDIAVFRHAVFKKDMPHWVLGSLKLKVAATQPNFFEKLYRILGNQQAHDAIWWLDDGNSFAIHTDNFSRDVLPYQYNGIKFKSFRRSLKRWDFKQVGIEGKTLIFQHPKLQRDILQCRS